MGGLGLNILSRRAICFWFWQEALQQSRPGFISRSQGRVRELERRAQERKELADSVDPQSDAALRQRRAYSGWSTSLNGIVPAATLTSLYPLWCPLSHCSCSGCLPHDQSHTYRHRTKRRGDSFQPVCVVFSRLIPIFLDLSC